ncbi:MAG: MmgE/PrpD family protein [Deltaproteobacteria bacterium]|nr:MmgE/PrpD family protein [Deltaproteobacteria bacterium]
MSTGKETVAQQLSEHLVRLDYQRLPANVTAKAKEALLDQLGCQFVGSTMSHSGIIYEFIRGFAGQPEATVVNRHWKTWAADAAFVNATFGHGCELDDHVSGVGGGHPGAICTAVALALGEKEQANGQAVIAAIAAGYETEWRVGRAMLPDSLHRGFHSQSLIGVFASAAVAARLLKLDATQLAHAFAIAGSHASGTREYTQSGGEVKRMHSGLAARGGIHSAMLAKAGLTGPLTIFEGKQGMLALFAGRDDPRPILEGLGEEFGVMHVEYKTYPVNIAIQSPIALLAELIQTHDIKATDVERIDVGLRNEHNVLSHGAIREPQDILGAQFSMAYSLAIRVVKRSNDLRLYTDPSVWRHPEVLRVARKVYLHADPRLARLKARGCHMKLTLTDGRVFEMQEEYQRGNPENPLTAAELTDKFRRLASSVFSRARTEEVINTVSRLDELEDVAELTSLLIPER